MTNSLRIAVYDGKYTFVKEEGDYRIHILRYGEPWVVIEVGCNAVHQLMMEVEELREQAGEDCCSCGDLLEHRRME